MITARLVMLILALVCFLVAAFDLKFPGGRVNLLAGGLVFLVLAQLVV